ncbi:MAG TPA: pyridoxal kinase PdxY [Methylomirabilota bacterium]|jgi:pyridoxine kinase|nr:pyridoxal kinase PdxY [Methylomirabilota bacterium]
MNLLSFQSKVVLGHVGHSAATLLLQRLGHEVWAVDTVCFSNHPGYGRYGGRVTPADEVAALAAGLEAIGAYASCAAVASGYLGSAANGAAMLEAVARVKRANPKAFYVCDPVMGDRNHGLYVSVELPRFFKEVALPKADMATPNAFELEELTGRPVRSLEEGVRAADELRALGPATVVVTGIEIERSMATVAVSPEGAWAVKTPRLRYGAFGTGDAFAALLLGRILNGVPLPDALALAVGGMYALIEASQGEGELALISAQDQAVQPSRSWRARRLR